MAESEPNTERLRAQAAFLLSQARAQAVEIERALASVPGEAATRSRLAAAAAQISSVTSELSQALGSSTFPLRAADLMSLGDIVQSGETSSLLAEAAAQAATSPGRAADIAAASADTRREVQSLATDVFDRKIFDPYLRFSSPEDEEEYRRREAEARKYINAQLALGTLSGNLNAGGGMLGVMLDADAHGAGDSPEFMPRWNALVEKTQRQRAAMRAAGQSTEEFDRNLTASVRTFLKSQGLSDAEIDRRLAASANPLDAVKPFLTSARDSRGLEDKIDLAAQAPVSGPPPLHVEASYAAPAPDAPVNVTFDAAAAKLKAVGLTMTDTNSAAPAHGLVVQKLPAKPVPSVAD